MVVVHVGDSCVCGRQSQQGCRSVVVSIIWRCVDMQLCDYRETIVSVRISCDNGIAIKIFTHESATTAGNLDFILILIWHILVTNSFCATRVVAILQPSCRGGKQCMIWPSNHSMYTARSAHSHDHQHITKYTQEYNHGYQHITKYTQHATIYATHTHITWMDRMDRR